MALMYPWATKEYLLWEMSLAQIILYHNIGFEKKYPQNNNQPVKASEMTHAQLKKKRDELRATYGEIGGDNG